MLLRPAKNLKALTSVSLSNPSSRTISTVSSSSSDVSLRRSFLYVPSSSNRMLEKSLTTKSDVIIYDLEDSVAPADKYKARSALHRFLQENNTHLRQSNRIAVRVNDITTPFFKDDISQVLRLSSVQTLVMPKINSALDLHHVSREIYALFNKSQSEPPRDAPVRIVASIESARSLWNLGDIAAWRSEYGPELGGRLIALLFAAEDYCADTSIIRTPSRNELLYTRSQIAITSKVFGLDAIDMVCVNYKDLDYLKDECEDGRHLGFNGKQAIHPIQVDTIQSTFVPTPKEILRAATILHRMAVAHASQKGAFGLELEGGGKEMIDAPMLKQAQKTIHIAKAAGIEIPSVN